jgi:Holliday junction DNA helicase RuvA
MFEYIKGILVRSSVAQVTIETCGLGYRVHIPFNHYAKLPAIGENALLFISSIIREDSHKLFGFLTEHERDLFEQLIEISGIGPKIALTLIGHMELQELQTAIQQGDAKAVCRIPGIGKKTAERLIMEMRDKMTLFCSENHGHVPKIQETGLVADAIRALIHLGYSQAQAHKAVKAAAEANGKETGLATLITASLRYI